MTMTSRRGFFSLFVLLTLASLLPVWSQRLLPMLDTPNHLALVRGWFSFCDPAYHISDFYTLRIKPVPYILFYASIHGLMQLHFSIETANKIFLSCYLVLFPLSVLYLLRSFGRSDWLAIGGFSLSFSQNWIFGFSSFLMGSCFTVLAVGALVRYLDSGRDRHLGALAIFNLLAFSGHILSWFVYGVIALALLLKEFRSWRRGVWVVLATLPACLLTIANFLGEMSEHTYLQRGEHFEATWKDVPTLLGEFPWRVGNIFPGHFDMLVFWVRFAIIAGLLLWHRQHREKEAPNQTSRLKVIFFVFVLLYFSLPFSIQKPIPWWNLGPRVVWMGMPFVLLLPAGPFADRRKWLLAPLVVLHLLISLRMTALYRSFDERNRGFIELADSLPLGAIATAVPRGLVRPVVEFYEDPASAGGVYLNFPLWPMALKGGFSPYIFNQGIPIRFREEIEEIKYPSIFYPDNVRPWQLPLFDYFIVRDGSDEWAPEDLSLQKIAERGDWTMYKRMYKTTEEP